MDLHEMIRYDIYKKKNMIKSSRHSLLKLIKKNAISEILIKSCNEDIIVKKSDLS